MKAPFMTIESAAIDIGQERAWIVGFAHGMGIRLFSVGEDFAMSREDYDRLKARVKAPSANDPARPVEV